MMRYLLSFMFVATFAGIATAQQAVVELKVTPEKSVFKDSAFHKPNVIKTKDDAAKHFGKDALDTIIKHVDFNKQIVLVFAWQGSGGDKLQYSILESFPEQVPFTRILGETDDLRSHTRVFALRSNVRWSVKK
jgi:hypothetical protein